MDESKLPPDCFGNTTALSNAAAASGAPESGTVRESQGTDEYLHALDAMEMQEAERGAEGDRGDYIGALNALEVQEAERGAEGDRGDYIGALNALEVQEAEQVRLEEEERQRQLALAEERQRAEEERQRQLALAEERQRAEEERLAAERRRIRQAELAEERRQAAMEAEYQRQEAEARNQVLNNIGQSLNSFVRQNAGQPSGSAGADSPRARQVRSRRCSSGSSTCGQR